MIDSSQEYLTDQSTCGTFSEELRYDKQSNIWPLIHISRTHEVEQQNCVLLSRYEWLPFSYLLIVLYTQVLKYKMKQDHKRKLKCPVVSYNIPAL